ncbi:MAG: response regulator transcription factor [Myxococcales bacterium]|nr:response regulator transcription factor [Myxococcales bacterium]
MVSVQPVTGKRKILLIEDDPNIVLGLHDALTFEGFEVVAADTAKKGLALAKQTRPNAIILDLMLPDGNGYNVCEELRKIDRIVPIVMLTARSSEADKIRGLDAGADDFLTKPFSVGELVARMRAIFRRVERSSDRPESFVLGSVQIHLGAHTVTRGKETEPLGFYEVGLLRALYERAGEPVSRDELLQRIWGLEASTTNRTVDNFIVKLRRKIERTPDKPEHILTVYGYGYKLAP